MMQILFTLSLALGFSTLTLVAPQVAWATEKTTQISGVVEHMESMENEAMIKLKGVSSLYTIRNLTDFPEVKLQKLSDSQEKGLTVKLKVNAKKQIVDVL